MSTGGSAPRRSDIISIRRLTHDGPEVHQGTGESTTTQQCEEAAANRAGPIPKCDVPVSWGTGDFGPPREIL